MRNNLESKYTIDTKASWQGDYHGSEKYGSVWGTSLPKCILHSEVVVKVSKGPKKNVSMVVIGDATLIRRFSITPI
jgi:hypothetical protein